MIRLCAMICLGASAAAALAGPTYSFTATQNNGMLQQGAVSNAAGTILEVGATWRAGSQRLSFNLKTDGTTDGFWLALSPGPNPKGTPGELALLYFDRGEASGNTSLAVYSYNGVNGSNSWNTPGDFIVSTEDGSGWDANLSAFDDFDGNRHLSFEIDASIIQAHVPNPPGNNSDWTGVSFGPQVGIWMHTVYTDGVRDISSFDANGRLTSFSFFRNGYWDGEGLQAVVVPLPTAAGLGLAGVGLLGLRRRR